MIGWRHPLSIEDAGLFSAKDGYRSASNRSTALAARAGIPRFSWLVCAGVGVALLLLAAPVPAEEQEHPNHKRGLAAPTSYLSSAIDSVNLFNGNLTLSIPIGTTYPAGGSLSYALALHYNSNVWEFDEGDYEYGFPTTYAFPTPHGNAGLGWLVGFGRLWAPGQPPQNRGTSWLLVEGDGTHRTFWPRLHDDICNSAFNPPDPEDYCEPTIPGVSYTRDGSYLRMRSVSGNRKEIDSPDGTTRELDDLGRVTGIRDRFGNRLDISYITQGGFDLWEIRDSAGGSERVHQVRFYRSPDWRTGQVESIRLAAFGGSTAVYSFEYTRIVAGTRHHKSNAEHYQGDEIAPLEVAQLTSLVLPTGERYEMSYFTENEMLGEGIYNPAQVIRTLRLPTLGTLQWDYGVYGFSQDNPIRPWVMTSDGVRFKKMIPWGGDPGMADKWEYKKIRRPDFLGSPPGSNNFESVTQVIDPLGNHTLHFFTNREGTWAHGLPFTPHLSAAGLYLSRHVFAGEAIATTPILRSEYVRFTADVGGSTASNQRLVSSRTVYPDDGNSSSTVPHAGFDGLGHYRTRVISGTFGGGASREETTAYNPGAGTYDFDANTYTYGPAHSFSWPFNPASPWILDTFVSRSQAEGGMVAHQELQFDSSTGFLQCLRTLEAGTLRGSHDIVTVFDRDNNGNVTSERTYGGDVQNLPTSSVCASLPGSWWYRQDHTYSWGSRSSSRYRGQSGQMPFYSARSEIDRYTGLPSRTYDSAGFPTDLTYDLLGRLIESAPGKSLLAPAAREARTVVTFTPASPAWGSFAKARIDRLCPQGVSGCSGSFGATEGTFDDFGRTVRERTLGWDGSFSRRETEYNALGWRTAVSEPGPDSGSLPGWTIFGAYDPFGRPGYIDPPDGSGHRLRFSYAGARWTSRTARVATSTNGESWQTTEEERDFHGRLRSVTEPNQTITRYDYRVGGELVRVCAGFTPPGTCAQERLFEYDNRGFLRSERHPEVGVYGNDKINYEGYDPKGHPAKRWCGQ